MQINGQTVLLPNHITAFQMASKRNARSLFKKFQGEMMLFASAFAKPMKICACLFLVGHTVQINGGKNKDS